MIMLEKDRLEEGRKRYSFQNAEFKEEDHPRAEDGKFGKGGGGAKEKGKSTEKKKEKITSLNPTGGIFVDHKPEDIMGMELGENITTLAETAGYDPDEKITVYRGISSGKGSIGPGDFITTNKQLAKDYAGTGIVVSETVRAGDILDDSDEPLGEEYLYYPKNKTNSSPIKVYRASLIFEKDRLAVGRERYSLKNSSWKEEDHPRGDDGRFGPGGVGANKETSSEGSKKNKVIEYKSIEAIKNHMIKTLKKFGYSIEESASNLSSSQYITASLEDKEYKIRISDHDLPPSYDSLHGYHDFDVLAEGKQRGGNEGTAAPYAYVVAKLAKLAGKEIPEHEKKIHEEWDKETQNREEERSLRLKEAEDTQKRIKTREETLNEIKEKDQETYSVIKQIQEKADLLTGDKRRKQLKKIKEILDDYGAKTNASVGIKVYRASR